MTLNLQKKPTLTLRKTVATSINAKTQQEVVSSDALIKTNKLQAKAKKQQPNTYKFYHIYNRLHTKYPKVISLEAPVALAMGIHKTILAENDINPSILGYWILEYFRRCRYYKVHVAGANRYNLTGEVVGIVTLEQEQSKQAMISRLVERKKQRDINKQELVENAHLTIKED